MFAEEFRKEYECNIEVGYKHSYIGLDIVQDRSTFTVSVGQTGYRKDIINRFEYLISQSKGSSMTPCNESILQSVASEHVSPTDKTEFMSIVMSVMFLARFTRPDLLFAVSVLSTHCNDCTRAHMVQAIKLLKYIAVSPDMAIDLNCNNCHLLSMLMHLMVYTPMVGGMSVLYSN